jgi:hypothetical protein
MRGGGALLGNGPVEGVGLNLLAPGSATKIEDIFGTALSKYV